MIINKCDVLHNIHRRCGGRFRGTEQEVGTTIQRSTRPPTKQAEEMLRRQLKDEEEGQKDAARI